MPTSEKGVGNSIVGLPQFFLPANTGASTIESYNTHAPEHWRLLQQIVPSDLNVRPIIFMTILPYREPTQGTSEYNNIAAIRYNQIEHDLNEIGATPIDDGGVERGAVNTAKALIQQMRHGDLAPPEISSLGSEAIVMLWAVGDRRFALTVTDGEYAYTLRRRKETLDRASGLNSENFDWKRLR